ncbi:hypothetical protein HC891_07300 [Candidatus Gracilibacteria bacterium]|nr:hypothetical protein [Candidatus Gracilibacteria bacterium]
MSRTAALPALPRSDTHTDSAAHAAGPGLRRRFAQGDTEQTEPGRPALRGLGCHLHGRGRALRGSDKLSQQRFGFGGAETQLLSVDIQHLAADAQPCKRERRRRPAEQQQMQLWR